MPVRIFSPKHIGTETVTVCPQSPNWSETRRIMSAELKAHKTVALKWHPLIFPKFLPPPPPISSARARSFEKGGACLRPSRDVATSLPRDARTSTSLFPGKGHERFFAHPSPVDGGRKDVFRHRSATTASLPCNSANGTQVIEALAIWDMRDNSSLGELLRDDMLSSTLRMH